MGLGVSVAHVIATKMPPRWGWAFSVGNSLHRRFGAQRGDSLVD